ncbi:MAG: hypothetical protein Tp164SUR323001_8 [Prokaryotic dsDNA virus sp.]|nr:MAG: hypothetical protein Tp164SUR323001_8 [Prokaryotic dsDNA virus sp.]|tara:strand:+ start:4048 stop:4578 length:531 start_codon:yes stop_codon:yes gene_type:complete
MATVKLTDKTALTEQAGSGDLLMVVDVSDTTGSSAGTSKKMDFKYVIQTDKISVSNAEFQALDSTPKTLVGALSGYMITVYQVTILTTYASATDSAGATLLFSYDSSEATNYWYSYRRFMNTVTTDSSFCFSPEPSSSGSCKSSLLNKPFVMFSSAAFNGGFSADVYVTYAYTKVL